MIGKTYDGLEYDESLISGGDWVILMEPPGEELPQRAERDLGECDACDEPLDGSLVKCGNCGEVNRIDPPTPPPPKLPPIQIMALRGSGGSHVGTIESACNNLEDALLAAAAPNLYRACLFVLRRTTSKAIRAVVEEAVAKARGQIDPCACPLFAKLADGSEIY